MVREHEQQASMPVALVIAGGEVGEGDGSTYETLVSAAASVGIFALAGGHPVSLTVPESHGWVTRRIEGRTHLLDELARLKALDTSLSDAMQSGDDSHSVGTTVVFIPSAGLAARSLPEVTAALKRAGSSVIAVLAEVSSWDDKVADDVDIARLRETCAVRRLAYKQELEVCLAD
jgi:uncharacterized protein (DUF58 family)